MIARFFIRSYQLLASPLLGCHCRFTPSCSHYAMEACEKHGALKGSWLAAKRVLRCHPFGGEGYDPVPEKSISMNDNWSGDQFSLEPAKLRSIECAVAHSGSIS